MIGSIENTVFTAVRSNSERLSFFSDSEKNKTEKTDISAVNQVETSDIFTLSEQDVKKQAILDELAEFQIALDAYRKKGDLNPLKELYDKTRNEALAGIFGSDGKSLLSDTEDSKSVFENLKKTENYEMSSDKMEVLAKRMEGLHKLVNSLFRFTDYEGIEDYITEATKLVDEASKMFKKAEKEIGKMDDGPEKTAAEQNLATLKSTLKRIVALAEKIMEKADILTAGMQEEPDSLKKFKKVLNDAKPFVADKPQINIETSTETISDT